MMFAGQRRGLDFQLREGMQVVVSGTVDVYERDGKYQLYAKTIRQDGIGDLYERFVRLRKELEEMGMFAAEYKKPIPRYARTVGVVTASTGAAIRDIMNISARRNPYVQLVLYPALVQGESAKYSIAEGIRTLDAMGLDVLIVGRGGGSIEDLWAFNEEVVARAIFECETPVISAVGHETDVTIADYVADLRAPTPSAAAELAVFDYQKFAERLELIRSALVRGAERSLETRRQLLERFAMRLRLRHPERQLYEKRQRLAGIQEVMAQAVDRKLLERKHRLAVLSGRLDGLSPLKRLRGGYGYLTGEDGKAVDTVDRIQPGQKVLLRISDGRICAQVTETEKLEEIHGRRKEGTDH